VFFRGRIKLCVATTHVEYAARVISSIITPCPKLPQGYSANPAEHAVPSTAVGELINSD
jgi:hypothetical protein